MPRMGRPVLPNYPHHIVQRGHNRQVVFAEEGDFRRYLEDLRELKDAFGVQVYAYCLMTNHVHLLLAPGEAVAGLGQLMKALAARMTRYRNRLERRSGTLWESRYKSSPVQTDQYLLACCRYIELNPVRAKMVATPEAYAWSSYRMRMGRMDADWLDRDPCYLELGPSEAVRQARYARFVREAIPAGEWELIQEALQRGQLTGNARFVEEVERIIGRRIEHRRPGRPAKEPA
jgi:putative transposase